MRIVLKKMLTITLLTIGSLIFYGCDSGMKTDYNDYGETEESTEEESTEEETTEEETSTSKTLTIGFSISANADVTPRSSADVYSGYIRNTDGDLVAINNIVIIYAEQLKTNTNYSAKVSDEEAGDYEVLINGTVPKGVTFKMENVIIEFNVNASHVTVESDFPSQVISGIEIPTTEFITTPIGEIQSGIMPNISSSPAGTKFRKSDGTFYTITN